MSTLLSSLSRIFTVSYILNLHFDTDIMTGENFFNLKIVGSVFFQTSVQLGKKIF